MGERTRELLAAIRTDPERSVVVLYRNAISDPDVDWRTVNEAIILRWSMTALDRIKRAAWAQRPASAGDEGGTGR